MKSYQLKIIIVLALFWYGCNFTQSYPPAFNSKKTAVIDSIKAKYGFEDITFLAKKQSGSSGKRSILIAKFINGKNIPSDTSQMTALQKDLGVQIETILKTPKEFDTYEILFSTITVKKGNLADVTNENYTGKDFKYDDLK
jgi:hypothetical protein